MSRDSILTTRRREYTLSIQVGTVDKPETVPSVKSTGPKPKILQRSQNQVRIMSLDVSLPVSATETRGLASDSKGLRGYRKAGEGDLIPNATDLDAKLRRRPYYDSPAPIAQSRKRNQSHMRQRSSHQRESRKCWVWMSRSRPICMNVARSDSYMGCDEW